MPVDVNVMEEDADFFATAAHTLSQIGDTTSWQSYFHAFERIGKDLNSKDTLSFFAERKENELNKIAKLIQDALDRRDIVGHNASMAYLRAYKALCETYLHQAQQLVAEGVQYPWELHDKQAGTEWLMAGFAEEGVTLFLKHAGFADFVPTQHDKTLIEVRRVAKL